MGDEMKIDAITVRLSQMCRNIDYDTKSLKQNSEELIRLGCLLEDVLRSNDSQGRLYYPDALYDSGNKRYRKAKSKKRVIQLEKIAKRDGLMLGTYLITLENTNYIDSIYSRKTTIKARKVDNDIFGNIIRQTRLERAPVGKYPYHIHGLFAVEDLSEIKNPEKCNPKPFIYDDLREALVKWESYQCKPSDCRAQRDVNTRRLEKSSDLLREALAEWYIWKLRNIKNGIMISPRTSWAIGLRRF